jgi:phage I-like protein
MIRPYVMSHTAQGNLAGSILPRAESLVATFAVAITSDEAPEWIELLPAGKFSAVDGRGPFFNEDSEKIIAENIGRMPQVGLVLDYDHSTDLAAPEGRPAPAAGWLKQFKVEKGAIFARIEWTKDAAEAVKEKKYRYVSPVFEHSKDGKIQRILRAALTNNPALVGLPAIASVQAMAEYAYTDSDGQGHLPIHDAAHVRNALARFGQTFFESHAKAATAWGHIKAAAKKFGVEVGDEAMPTPKIKEPSSGYTKSAAEEGHMDKPKLSAIMEALEKAHPGASHKKLMKAAMALTKDDDEEEEESEEEDPYEKETEDQMAARHKAEMVRCTTDGERAETTARHAKEKERFAARQVRGLEHVAKPGGGPGRDVDGSEKMSAAIAKHPMVVSMANEINSMRQEQAKVSATQKVDAAIREGRLIPSQREWAISYCTAMPRASTPSPPSSRRSSMRAPTAPSPLASAIRRRARRRWSSARSISSPTSASSPRRTSSSALKSRSAGRLSSRVRACCSTTPTAAPPRPSNESGHLHSLLDGSRAHSGAVSVGSPTAQAQGSVRKNGSTIRIEKYRRMARRSGPAFPLWPDSG